MATRDQVRWMELIELLNSEEFDYPMSWFEHAEGRQSTLMANRIVATQHIPQDAKRLRIDGSIWVRSDDVIYQDIEKIHAKLRSNQACVISIVNNALYIELAPDNAP